MRDAAIAVMREIGRGRRADRHVQFAVNPGGTVGLNGDRDESPRIAVVGAGCRSYRVSQLQRLRRNCRGLHAGRNSNDIHAQDARML